MLLLCGGFWWVVTPFLAHGSWGWGIGGRWSRTYVGGEARSVAQAAAPTLCLTGEPCPACSRHAHVARVHDANRARWLSPTVSRATCSRSVTGPPDSPQNIRIYPTLVAKMQRCVRCSEKFGLAYVVSKMGLLFVYAVDNLAAVYRQRISADPVFLAQVPPPLATSTHLGRTPFDLRDSQMCTLLASVCMHGHHQSHCSWGMTAALSEYRRMFWKALCCGFRTNTVMIRMMKFSLPQSCRRRPRPGECT